MYKNFLIAGFFFILFIEIILAQNYYHNEFENVYGNIISLYYPGWGYSPLPPGAGGGGGGGGGCTPDCSGCSCSSCEGCPDGIQCDDSCSSGTLTSSISKTTWYYANAIQDSKFYNTTQYYSSPPTFTDKDYYCKRGSSCDDGCGGTCCTNYYDSCSSTSIACKEWQKCVDDDSTGCLDESTGCICVEDYCKGWCIDNAPVYDGLASCSPANDGDWIATPKFPSKPSKYSLNRDYHSANMGGGCYCNYYQIKNYYECDSSKINDSHPCSSNNCAPDFKNGRAYCCPSGWCAHNGTDVTLISGSSSKSTNTEYPDLYCYSDNSIISYEGYELRCDNGVWVFNVDCGETIYNFTITYDEHVVYPSGYGYKNSYINYPIDFTSSPHKIRNVTVFINPSNSGVVIEIFDKDNNIVASGTGDTKVSAIIEDRGLVRFYATGSANFKNYSYYVSCYIPDTYSCNITNDLCYPNSYCTQDQISAAHDSGAGPKDYTYCCPDSQCAYNSGSSVNCYLEGTYYHLDGICAWKCIEGTWSKLDRGEVCQEDCDCKYIGYLESYTGEYNLNCTDVLYGDYKICCEPGKCGLELGICVNEGSRYYIPGLTNYCVCNNGIWFCNNISIKRDFSKVLFTKKLREYNTTKIAFNQQELSNIGTINNAKLIIYFDKGTYSGNININGNSYPINNKIEVTLSTNPVDLPKYLYISINSIGDSEYFYYLGSVLILEITT